MTTTLSIRLSSDTKAQLGLVAVATRRSKSFLAAEAVAAYVAREGAIIAGIERGLADMKAGQTVPHEAAMDELDALIDGITHDAPVSAEEFDRRFDDGEDMSVCLDWSRFRRPGLEPKRVNLDIPQAMVAKLDTHARKRGVTRQAQGWQIGWRWWFRGVMMALYVSSTNSNSLLQINIGKLS